MQRSPDNAPAGYCIRSTQGNMDRQTGEVLIMHLPDLS